MRRTLVLLIVLTIALPAFAEDWTTADGKTYKNVTILSEEDDGVRVTYDGGVGKLPYYELPLDVQKRLGRDIDALRAKKEAADKALAEAMANAATPEQQKQQEAAAAAAQAQKLQQAQAQSQAQAAGKNPPGVNVPGKALAPGQATAPGQGLTPAQAQAQAQAQNKPGAAGPASAPAPSVPKDPYPGARYSYNAPLDICYLDSFPAAATPEVPSDPDAPAPTAPPGTFTLRITSDGRLPSAPAKIEAIYASNSAVKDPGNYGTIGLFIDGLRTAMHDIETKDTNSASTPGQIHVAFYLTPAQAHAIIAAKNAEIGVGAVTYQFDESGIASLRRYFAQVDQLPPPPTGWARTWHKFMIGLPAMLIAISTACEYIVVGSFAILVIITIAAFAMGMSRFIKM